MSTLCERCRRSSRANPQFGTRIVGATVAVIASTVLVLTGCALAPTTSPAAAGSVGSWHPEGALVYSDLAYGSDPHQKLDVYQPEGAQNAPILLMVHGGWWTGGDKAASGVVHNKVAHYLPMGYVFVSTNYRLSPAVDPVTQAGDVASALAYVQAHASEWGGSAKNIVLVGHSAGANLVSLLAADPTIAYTAGAMPWLGTVVLDSAAYNLMTIMRNPHNPLYDPVFGTDAQVWRGSSPTLRMSGPPSPMLLVCESGRADSCPQAKEFADEVAARYGKARGAAIHVYPVNLTHRQISRKLGTPLPLTKTVDAFLQSLAPQNNARSTR